jgi:hypothetical protein
MYPRTVAVQVLVLGPEPALVLGPEPALVLGPGLEPVLVLELVPALVQVQHSYQGSANQSRLSPIKSLNKFSLFIPPLLLLKTS